jgi:hypothetical protein
MTDTFSDSDNESIAEPNKYSGERSLELYEILVGELNSAVENNIFKIGSSRFKIFSAIRWDEEWEQQSFVHFHYGDPPVHAIVEIHYHPQEGDHGTLEAYHHTNPATHEVFYFPINDERVQRKPAYFFRKWMEIAITSRSIEEHQARFNQCILDDSNFENRISDIKEIYRHGDGNPDLRQRFVPSQWRDDVFGSQEIMEMINKESLTPDIKRYGYSQRDPSRSGLRVAE